MLRLPQCGEHRRHRDAMVAHAGVGTTGLKFPDDLGGVDVGLLHIAGHARVGGAVPGVPVHEHLPRDLPGCARRRTHARLMVQIDVSNPSTPFCEWQLSHYFQHVWP